MRTRLERERTHRRCCCSKHLLSCPHPELAWRMDDSLRWQLFHQEMATCHAWETGPDNNTSGRVVGRGTFSRRVPRFGAGTAANLQGRVPNLPVMKMMLSFIV